MGRYEGLAVHDEQFRIGAPSLPAEGTIRAKVVVNERFNSSSRPGILCQDAHRAVRFALVRTYRAFSEDPDNDSA
jgi:hypothetical protein